MFYGELCKCMLEQGQKRGPGFRVLMHEKKKWSSDLLRTRLCQTCSHWSKIPLKMTKFLVQYDIGDWPYCRTSTFRLQVHLHISKLLTLRKMLQSCERSLKNCPMQRLENVFQSRQIPSTTFIAGVASVPLDGQTFAGRTKRLLQVTIVFLRLSLEHTASIQTVTKSEQITSVFCMPSPGRLKLA